jgi:hypothetical protein
LSDWYSSIRNPEGDDRRFGAWGFVELRASIVIFFFLFFLFPKKIIVKKKETSKRNIKIEWGQFCIAL